MRFSCLAAALVLSVAPTISGAQAVGFAPLTLAEALRLAEAASPTVRSREAQLSAAEGARRESASPLFSNPELSLQHNSNRVRQSPLPDDRYGGTSVGLSQTIEIGGQPLAEISVRFSLR